MRSNISLEATIVRPRVVFDNGLRGLRAQNRAMSETARAGAIAKYAIS